MNRLLKFSLALLPLLILGIWFVFTPKGEMNINKAKVEIETNANGLYAAFEENETQANETYVGKVIQVSGILESVAPTENGTYELKLATASELGQVICNLTNQDKSIINSLIIGQSSTVKGVCTGYLFDVVVDNAMILNN